MERPVYPFTAIVGQDEMKDALVACAIDPSLGGVLIFGDRGTGKSTAVRALAALLPPIEAPVGCPYRCDPARRAGLCACCDSSSKAPCVVADVPRPVVDLPLGASEDRVTGGLNLQHALTSGEKIFEPGLLAAANRGFLYIDEINLLEDHLVDLLLDVAASGENVVERDGLGVRHPARFVLVGSGNPEEGELRPQLLDRFGIAVDVVTPVDLDQRIDIIHRRDAFDRDPDRFVAQHLASERALQREIEEARALVGEVQTPKPVLRTISELCVALGTDGLRGELTVMKAARVVAARAGRKRVREGDVVTAAPGALRHRLRRDPLDEAGSAARVERAIDTIFRR
ncbi:MAG: magnesium chelatase ATPase subunit I [Pseudomonadota bacterium]